MSWFSATPPSQRWAYALTALAAAGALPVHAQVVQKIPRVVDCFARRLQVQERMTQQIAQTLQDVLAPRGVAEMGLLFTGCCMAHYLAGVDGIAFKQGHDGALAEDGDEVAHAGYFRQFR